MTSYIQYHVQSGHIESQLTVVEQSHLEKYRREGREFMPMGNAEPVTMYVKLGGALADRTHIPTPFKEYVANLGESIEVTGLPNDCYISCNGAYLKAVGGKVVFTNNGQPDVRFAEPAGKYKGSIFGLTWSDIAQNRIDAKAQIDADAETARSRVITLGSGQAMTYMRKAEAAHVFLQNGTLTDAQMLRLQDEATRLGVTITQAAQAISATANAWETIDATIDSIRLNKKKEIDAATTGKQVAAIVRSIVWPV